MAQLRLIGATIGAAAALVGGAARADAPGAPTPPAGWRALPKVAAALASGAKADGVTVEASEAWGDPGRGCFAVWLALRGTAPATADQIVASLAGSPIRDVAPAADRVTLAFEHPPFHGHLRVALAGQAVRALACFGDGREPVACDAACGTLLPGGGT